MNFIKKNYIYLTLGAIILFGLFLRYLPLNFYIHQTYNTQKTLVIYGDAKDYKKIALIFLNNGLSGIFDAKNEIYKDQNIPALTAFRTPAYPLFISTIYKVSDTNPLNILIVQIFLDLITIYLVFKTTLIFFKKKIPALLAAFLYAINPLAIMYVVSMYAESFFTFFLSLTIFLFASTLEKNKIWKLALVGFLLGITTLIKPIALYLLPVFLIGIIFSNESWRTNWKKCLSSFAIILILFLITLAPWQLRNLIMYKHYKLTFQQGRELLVWRVGTCMAWNQNLNRTDVWNNIQAPYLSTDDLFKRSKIEQDEAIKYITTHPYQYTLCNLKGISNFFVISDLFNVFPAKNSNAFVLSSTRVSVNYLKYLGIDKTSGNLLSKIYEVLLIIQYLIILAGAWILITKKETRAATLFIIFTIIYFAILAGVDGYSRYYYPITPIITILTVVSLWAIAKKFK